MRVKLIVASLLILLFTTVVGNSSNEDFRENFLSSMSKCYLEYYKNNPDNVVVP